MNSFTLQIDGLSDEEALHQFGLNRQQEVDDIGETPLIAAIRLGRVQLVQSMIERGFDPMLRTYIASPIGAAIDGKGLAADEILLVLLKVNTQSLNMEAPDYYPELNEPVTHGAVRRGKTSTVRLLLEYGAFPDWPDTDGVSAIELAEEMNDQALIKLLNG